MRNFATSNGKGYAILQTFRFSKNKKWQRPQDAFKREIPCSWKWGHYALC